MDIGSLGLYLGIGGWGGKELFHVTSCIYSSEHTARILTWNYKQKKGKVSFSNGHLFNCCWTLCLETQNYNRGDPGRIQAGKTDMMHRCQGWNSLDTCL